MEYDDEIKIGVAFGAGGMRGMAHLGVIEVLQEENIPIHCVSGCSMGSIIACLYACGVSTDFIAKYASTFTENSPLDITVPRRGFIKGEKMESRLRTLTADRTFADLEMPVSIIATDYTHAECVTFRTGDPEKLYRAIHASCAIPGVFQPVQLRDTVMVDGGVIRRLPIQECEDMGADLTIAVDVGFRAQTDLKSDTIMEIIMNSFSIMQWQRVEVQNMNNTVLIEPDVYKYNSLGMSSQDLIIEEGRKAARAMIPEIRRKIEDIRNNRLDWCTSI